jgi:hypothetical protein
MWKNRNTIVPELPPSCDNKLIMQTNIGSAGSVLEPLMLLHGCEFPDFLQAARCVIRVTAKSETFF